MKWENDTFTLPPFGNSDLRFLRPSSTGEATKSITEQAAKPITAQDTEFFASKANGGRADYPTFETWYKKMHKVIGKK